MTIQKLIVVVGINGRQSSSVVDALLEYPDEFILRGTTDDLTSIQSQEFARRGVDIVKCDISNQQECSRAFNGAYGVFSINKHWDAVNQDEWTQVYNLIDTARIENVQHFIASGLPDTRTLNKNEHDILLDPMRQTTLMEEYIRRLLPNSTFPHVTYIRMGFYYQNFITFFVPDAENLEFRYPREFNSRLPLYDVRDTGKVIRECFRKPERWGDGQTVPIVAEFLTMDGICKMIHEVTGKHINFVPLSYDEACRKLHRETVNYLRWYNEISMIDEREAEKTKEICPNMKTLADWVREIQWLIE